jgi:hypothetical protein
VAAIAAIVLLFGGVFGQDTAARPGPFAAEAEVKRGYAELELGIGSRSRSSSRSKHGSSTRRMRPSMG